MMPALLALLVAGGTSVWVFTKLQNQTGRGNSKNAIIGAGTVFVLGFVVLFSILRMLLK